MTQRLSFSQLTPDLQLAWDSTSISALKLCPRYYQLSIVLGYAPRDESVHLTFGLHYHSALEAYDRARATGASYEAGVREAVRVALTKSWDSARNRPWASDHKLKHRESLVRSIVWYLDQFEDDPLETIILANGKPAVEMSFRLPLERKSAAGEEMLLCGHFDRAVNWQGGVWVADHKTSAYAVDERFFEKFSPDNQMSTYSYAGRIVWSLPIKGIIINAVQIGVTFSRFQRGFTLRSDAQLDEWRRDLDYWLSMAEYFATTGYYPANDKSCGMYGGCQFRPVCSKSPGQSRMDWLKHSYVNRSWDPLRVRGDI
jgi:hypothetical protein